MMFNRTIDPRCAYCKRGTPLNQDTILCIKRGVVKPEQSCRRFSYDPLKRTPPQMNPPSFDKLTDEDFSL